MPLLNITESKKVTAIITIEETTARQIELYAAMTKGNPDDVVQRALNYVFSKDKDFEKYEREHATAKPKIALRLKKPANAVTSADSTAENSPAAHKGAR